jgi:predicted XRE-type DNA-binding protein
MQDSNSKEEIEFERGSGNVFADLGLSNPVERQAKARLMYTINCEIKRQGLRQTEAADRVGLSQPDISKIACGHGAAFSIDRLLAVLTKLGIEIEITLHHGNGGVVVRELV